MDKNMFRRWLGIRLFILGIAAIISNLIIRALDYGLDIAEMKKAQTANLFSK